MGFNSGFKGLICTVVANRGEKWCDLLPDSFIHSIMCRVFDVSVAAVILPSAQQKFRCFSDEWKNTLKEGVALVLDCGQHFGKGTVKNKKVGLDFKYGCGKFKFV